MVITSQGIPAKVGIYRPSDITLPQTTNVPISALFVNEDVNPVSTTGSVDW